VYLGWITVAAVANVTDWLYLVEWNGFGISAPVWAVIMIAVASVVGLLMTLTRKDAAYVFVLVWSFIGIAVKQAEVANVAAAAWIGAGLMLVLAVYSLTRRRTA
jgi:4-amino-4-deoxy-L-arabinose transferase-like glycosyltransferase